jgi:hypothetical protein
LSPAVNAISPRKNSARGVVSRASSRREDVEHHRPLVHRRLQLDEAHAAVGRRREARVPAVMRDLDSRLLGRADDALARLEGDVFTVKLEGRHLGFSALSGGQIYDELPLVGSVLLATKPMKKARPRRTIEIRAP